VLSGFRRRAGRGGRVDSDSATAVSLVTAYKAVLEVPFRGTAIEALAWSVPGLLYPRRAGHPRLLLLFFAAFNVVSVLIAKRSIARHPEFLLSRRYLLRQSAESWLRYVLYAAVVPRRTYWRGRLDNQAFFAQSWWPIALWGLGQGPQWSLRVAPLHAYLFYVGSAWANGEPLLLPREVRRNILNYSNMTIWTGAACTLLFGTLKKASDKSAAERLAVAERLAAQKEEGLIRELTRSNRQEVTRSLLHVRSAAREALPPLTADKIANYIDEILARPWVARYDDVDHSALAIAESIGSDCGVQVRPVGPNIVLSNRSVGTMRLIHGLGN
jgi:hypothetical protein